MGNEQSAPAPRGPRNKLTKPRTNSSTNTTNGKGSAPSSRRNSHSNLVGISNKRYSTVSVDRVVGEAGAKKRDESTSRKRMSIFRSKSSQPKVQQLDIASAADIDYLDPSPEWSRNNSVTEDLREQRHYSAPLERYITLIWSWDLIDIE
jgi:hypothetical protein